jgi:hypothetical protein
MQTVVKLGVIVLVLALGAAACGKLPRSVRATAPAAVPAAR